MLKKVAWMHYPLDDMDANTLTSRIMYFHNCFNFEFIKVSTNSNSICHEFGIRRNWEGDQYGSYAKNQTPYNPNHIFDKYSNISSVYKFELLLQNLITHKNISQLSNKTVYATVYSPIYHLKVILGNKISLRDIKIYGNMLKTLTNITKEYIIELQKIPKVQIYYYVFHAHQEFCSLQEFQEHLMPYEQSCIDKIIDNNNIIHFHNCQDFINEYIRLGKFNSVSVDKANENFIDKFLSNYKNLFFIGGLDIQHLKNPETLNDRLKFLKYTYGNKNYIIGPSCTLPITIEPSLLNILSNYE